MASSVEEKFKETIEIVFEDRWKDIEPLYNKVIEKEKKI